MKTAESSVGAGFLGSVADTPLAEVFQRIAQEGRSGDLQLTLPKAIKTVYFDRGFVVFASSNLKNDRLGESMIEAGRISRHEFALATMVMRSTRRKFGETLVEAGIVSEEELGQHVARQVNRIVLSLFSAKEGVYSFDERPCTIPVELMVSLSVYRILLEGTRRMTSKRLVLVGLPPLDTKLVIDREPPFTLDVDKLRPVERDVLRCARVGARIVDIVRMVGGDDGLTLRAVYGLCCAGVLEAVANEPQRRILKVQEETGSFVLSEIRRKVEAPRELEAEVEPETESEPAFTTHQEVRAPEAAPPSVRPEPPPRPAATKPAPTPSPVRAPSSEPRWEAFRARLRALWRVIWDPIERALLRWVKSSGEPAEELEAPKGAERPSPVAERHEPAPEPEEPKAVATATPEDEVGVPTWSITAEPPELTELEDAEDAEASEVPIRMEPPSWSIHDEDRDEEPDVAASDSSVGVPSWSILDSGEDDAPAESAPLSSLDNELYIEGDPESGLEPSMLSQIPVEEIAFSEETVAIEIEVEEEPLAESEEPTETNEAIEIAAPASVEPQAARKELPVLAAQAPQAAPKAPVEDEQSAEDRASASRAEAMRRMKQSGGEGRLVRDVKLHFKLQDWEGAIPLLEQLLAISPGTALYRGMLARAMSRVPHLRKDAEEHFIEALRLAPQDAELHYWLGLYYKAFGLGSRALTEFRTTLRIDPKHEGARKQLGAARKDDALGTVLKKIFG